MAETTILGIDPAMDNLGWMHLRLNTETPFRNPSPLPEPDWILEKEKTGVHTYQHFERIDGGTFKSDKNYSWLHRIQCQVDEIHKMIHKLRPTILAMESQLDKGDNKNPTGLSVQNLIVAPFFHPDKRIFHRYVALLSGTTTESSEDEQPLTTQVRLLPEHIPEIVFMLRPERLQSIAHYERTTKGSRVVGRYKQLYPEDKRRLSQHEADAFFIAVHAGRFWATCLNSYWPKTHLTFKENHVFLEEQKGILQQKDEAWWRNELLPVTVV
jgi:Holliday junction resolvasome RuvABC endonuclease subunit